MVSRLFSTILFSLPISVLAYPSIVIQVNNATGVGFNLDPKQTYTRWAYYCANGYAESLKSKISPGLNTVGSLCADSDNPGDIYGVFSYFIQYSSTDKVQCLYAIHCKTSNMPNGVCGYSLSAIGTDISQGNIHASNCSGAVIQNPTEDNGYVAIIRVNLNVTQNIKGARK